MCIYYKDQSGLKYTSQEHIIPAGIGGKSKLSKGLVSDEFNNSISKVERKFLQSSLMSIPRVMLGPGKRGSLAESKATKSKIHLITSHEDETIYAIGYTKLGKVFEIPHMKLDTQSNKVEISFDNSVPEFGFSKAIADFLKKCTESDQLKIKEISDKNIPVNIALIGIMNGIEKHYNCFIIIHPTNKLKLTTKKISAIANGIKSNGLSANNKTYMPTVHDTADFSIDYFRIYGKIAFNFLASLKGKEFVLNKCFDNVRTWIASGGENNFANMLENAKFPPIGFSLPDDAHVIIITKIESRLVAYVYLYYHFGVQIILSDNFVENFLPNGLISDWKNNEEYLLQDYLFSKLTLD